MYKQYKRISELMIEIDNLIDFREMDKLKEYLNDIHPMDLVDIIKDLNTDKTNIIFDLLDIDKASQILEAVEPDSFVSLIKRLDKRKREIILDHTAKDDIVDILSELNQKRALNVIDDLEIEDSKEVKKLLSYDPEVAGGIMTSDYVYLEENKTKLEAIKYLEKEAPEAETIYYIYIVDNNNKLVGVLSLRELLVAKKETLLKDIMSKNIIHVNVYDDQEEVAHLVSKYDLLAIPVIDDFNKLKGIITVDDIIDVIEDEATEDFMKFAGSSEEIISDKDIWGSIVSSTKARLPWLIITVFGGLISATVVNRFQGIINTYTLLSLFMPLLAGMGGNVGTQSSTITVRNLAIGQIESKDILKTLAHEVSVGVIVGLVCASLVGFFAFILHEEMILSVIVGVAMMGNIITAATIGTLIPLIFDKLGVDPAVASAPFITTTVDITGLSIYFTLATILLTKLG
ncbi:MAG: magnesium transporter [Bacillota bacterium]